MVSMGVMAPLAGVPLQSPVTRQITPGSNWKTMACNRRAMASSMASDGVEPLNGSSSHGHNVPKAKPFNQSRISRLLREPSLLEKADQALAERCTHLEGDEAYRCWEALFEFENIKEAYQQECDAASGDERASACRRLERFQNLVRQSGGVSGLIDNIRMVARTARKQQAAEPSEEALKGAERPVFPEDGGLPQDPVAEESSGLLPESNLTRMLRHSGRSPAWFTQRPDHDSD